MRRRKLAILIALLLLAVAIGIVVYLSRRAAPEPVRLLPPNADAVIYVDVQTIRRAVTLFGQAPAVPHDPEYDNFIRQTGFQFERDLDQAAFAVHAPPLVPGGPPPAPEDVRSSEIFVGRFDSGRLSAFLSHMAISSERYHNIDIFSIPNEGRTVRVAILGLTTVAVSNAADPQPMHEMIDRYVESALPLSGPPLVRDHYHDVPLGSVVWAIAQVPEENGTSGLTVPALLRTLAPGATLVASLRYTGSIQFRVEALAKSEEQARKITENAGTMLSIFRGVESSAQMGGPDPDVKAFFDSIAVSQEGSHAILRATFTQGFLQKALSEAPVTVAPEPPPPTQKKSTPKRGSKSKAAR
jgi:hypothetical protein